MEELKEQLKEKVSSSIEELNTFGIETKEAADSVKNITMLCSALKDMEDLEEKKLKREQDALEAEREQQFKIDAAVDANDARKAQEIILKKKNKWDHILKGAEVVGVIALIPIIDNLFKGRFLKKVNEFEKDDSYTSTPGRTTSSLFKWKR